MSKHRTLRHEHEYDTAAESLIREDARYASVIQVTEWGISTCAEAYPLASAAATGLADIRVAPGDPIGGLDPIHVLFTIDDADSASLWWVGKVDLSDFLDDLS